MGVRRIDICTMTVYDPTFPSCDCEDGDPKLAGTARVPVEVSPDGEGGINWIEPILDGLNGFEDLQCNECGHEFITDGEIVDDRITGNEV